MAHVLSSLLEFVTPCLTSTEALKSIRVLTLVAVLPSSCFVLGQRSQSQLGTVALVHNFLASLKPFCTWAKQVPPSTCNKHTAPALIGILIRCWTIGCVSLMCVLDL